MLNENLAPLSLYLSLSLRASAPQWLCGEHSRNGLNGGLNGLQDYTDFGGGSAIIWYLAHMYTKDQASRIKHEFWTTFGRYMRPIPSAETVKVNWMNYHTGIKDVYFRMDAGSKSAMISISIELNDATMRALYYEQLLQFKDILHATLEETWQWELHAVAGGGREISRTYKDLPGVSVFNKNDWPELISFFKPRIMALDSFWSDAKYSFQALGQ